MEDETMVEDETLEVQEEVEQEETEDVQEEIEEDEVDWKAEAEKAKKLAENQRIRAEKAEKKAKSVKTENTSSLSTSDILALTKANIDEDDIDDVLEYAAFKKVSVKDALNSSILKATIAEKSEQRRSAEAVNTGSTRRANGQVSDERLIADAQKGNMPESESDIARLVKLRLKK